MLGVPNGYGKFVYVHNREESNKHSFVYMGYFLNGILHGKEGRLLNGQGYKLECEFVNGIANGFGKFFYPGGNIMYEGEYREGKKTGIGRKYYASGKIMFEGQLIDSIWTGFGRKYLELSGQVSYEGACLNNVPHGFGRYYHPSNGALWYEGHFASGKFDGFGRLTDAADFDGTSTLYVGEWLQGLKHGLGAYYYDAEYVFEGRWKRDMKVEGSVTYLNEWSRQVFFTNKELNGSHFLQKNYKEKKMEEESSDEEEQEERKSEKKRKQVK
ncbi:hypothetical protein FGO68_gene10987 [Halteria grandinella]|uniref:MORN repeat protein n=1 Tax=Halteria grandinella TaxID=5974 RepID=A0A8J8NE62_HALGN|nr:hypothetical protein FGO68_gene10987 [Halteria grandinella]